MGQGPFSKPCGGGNLRLEVNMTHNGQLLSAEVAVMASNRSQLSKRELNGLISFWIQLSNQLLHGGMMIMIAIA